MRTILILLVYECYSQIFINPRRMRRRVTVLILSVCLSVYLLPRNLLSTSFLRRKEGIIGFFMMFSRFLSCGFLLKTLPSRVLVSFAGHRRLPRSLASFQWTKKTAMASFQLEEYVLLAIDPTRRLARYWLEHTGREASWLCILSKNCWHSTAVWHMHTYVLLLDIT